MVLVGDVVARGRGRVARTGPLAQRTTRRHRLGRATLPVLAGFVALVGLALGVPIGSSLYWMFEGARHALTGVSIARRRLAHRPLQRRARPPWPR